MHTTSENIFIWWDGLVIKHMKLFIDLTQFKHHIEWRVDAVYIYCICNAVRHCGMRWFLVALNHFSLYNFSMTQVCNSFRVYHLSFALCLISCSTPVQNCLSTYFLANHSISSSAVINGSNLIGLIMVDCYINCLHTCWINIQLREIKLVWSRISIVKHLVYDWHRL